MKPVTEQRREVETGDWRAALGRVLAEPRYLNRLVLVLASVVVESSRVLSGTSTTKFLLSYGLARHGSQSSSNNCLPHEVQSFQLGILKTLHIR